MCADGMQVSKLFDEALWAEITSPAHKDVMAASPHDPITRASMECVCDEIVI